MRSMGSKVYIVEEVYYYDGSSIKGVYAKKEDAIRLQEHIIAEQLKSAKYQHYACILTNYIRRRLGPQNRAYPFELLDERFGQGLFSGDNCIISEYEVDA